jgi:hypothetical protein
MTRTQYLRIRGAVATLATLLCAATASAQTPIPLDTEFQVNQITTGNQRSPSISSDGADGFVVVWSTPGSVDTEIVGRRLDSVGSPAGDEFPVNDYTTGQQAGPQVSRADDGAFVVVWESDGSPGDDSSGSSAQARQFTSAADPIAGQFQVNTTVDYDTYSPVVAADAAGTFVVAWTAYLAAGLEGAGEQLEALGQRVDSAGVFLGEEFQVNASSSGVQEFVRVAADGNGGFWTVWDTAELGPQDPDGIYLRRVDSDGAPVGSDFQVNEITTGSQVRPDLAVGSDGSFLVVWSSDQEGDDGIRGRRFASNGDPNGSEFAVQQGTLRGDLPTIASDNLGGFLVGWFQGSTDGAIYGRRVNSTGLPVGSDFAISSVSFGYRDLPDIAYDGNRGFLVVWDSELVSADDDSGRGVQARRVALDDDGDAVPDAADCDPADPTNTSPLCAVFADGFESGDTTAWSSSVP